MEIGRAHGPNLVPSDANFAIVKMANCAGLCLNKKTLTFFLKVFIL